MRDIAQSAEKILLPKGDDNSACVQAFQEWADIEVPTFRGRELVARSGGKVFWLLKGRDIPGLIAAGKADIGMAGTDSRIEYNEGYPDKKMRSQRIGNEAMCRFSLLGLEETAAEMEQIMDSRTPREALQTTTSFPNTLHYLRGNLPVTAIDIPVSGSVEGAMKLLGTPLAADIVDTGNTITQNGLVEIQKLMDIYPEVFMRTQEGVV